MFSARITVLTLLMLVAAAAAATAQTSDGLRRRYGPPVEGHYTLRPGVTATATFTRDKHVCEMVVESDVALSPEEVATNSLPADPAEGVIDELVPPGQRGKGSEGIAFQSSCNIMQHSTYERVTISRTTGCTLKDGASHLQSRIVIRWKAQGCK